MDFIPEEIDQYARDHSSEESSLLKKIHRDTHAEVLMPRMVSGHLQGRFLSMISNMIKPKAILEIGTYTGYSAICLAEGLAEGGRLITIDINEELEARVSGYFKEAGLEQKIDYRIGDAVELIPGLKESFDLVFLDADKENYQLYFDLIFDKMAVGGFLLADNVLWSGKVVGAKEDKDTKAIKSFNNRITNDLRLEKMLLPLRDGIMMVRKIS